MNFSLTIEKFIVIQMIRELAINEVKPIAINKEAESPTLKVADLAIVGDYTKILPELVA